MARTAIVYVTDRCNLRCVFCLERNDSWRGFCEPSTEAVCAQIDALRARGADHLTFMGAETFFRKDLAVVLAHARSVGLSRLGVVTNGTVLSKKGFLRPLIDAGLSFIELSIHGHTPDLANSISGKPFTWQRQREAMDELSAVGLPAIVNVVICRANREAIADIAQYVADRLGDSLLWVKLKFVGQFGAAASNDAVSLRYDEVDPKPAARWLIDRGRDVRFYNFPLCQLGDLAPHAHEADSIAADETFFDFDHHGSPDYTDSGHQLQGHVWPAKPCSACTLRPLCPGLEGGYFERHGADAIHARSDDAVNVLRMALAARGSSADPAARLAALSALARPAPRVATPEELSDREREIRWEHKALPEPLVLWLDANNPSLPAFAKTRRFALTYAPWTSGDAYAHREVVDALASARALVDRADRAGLDLAAVRRALRDALGRGRAVPVRS